MRHVTPSLTAVMLAALLAAASAGAQVPDHPKNLQALPKTLSTDSVWKVMIGVVNALGTTCGTCHVGGDNPTWDSTNFGADTKPKKLIAREMIRMTARLNAELIPAALRGSTQTIPVTCATCHRAALRPYPLEDTLMIVVDRLGVDSALAVRERLKAGYAGRAYDLTDIPLRQMAARLMAAKRAADAIAMLETATRESPRCADCAYQLGVAYQAAGRNDDAIAQFHRVLSLSPRHSGADKRLRELLHLPPPAQGN